MSEAMTYTSLISDVQIYVDRTDDPFVTQIPRFVMLAENRLASEVRGLGSQQYVIGAFSGNTLAKPSRWRETISFNFTNAAGERVFLQPRTYDYCRAFWPDPATTGTPRYYADYAYEHFLIVPTPSTTFAFELAYYERPERIAEFQALYDRALQGIAQESSRRIGADRAATSRTGE